MKKVLLSIIILGSVLIIGCKKGKDETNVSECALFMKKKFDKELICSQKGKMESNLYVGTYKNQEVYFVNTMCPACNTLPPQFGYTCGDKKVDFDDFSKVENIKQVYNSCTQEFSK